MIKTIATVVLTAILTSAFWIFAFGITRSPEGEAARAIGAMKTIANKRTDRLKKGMVASVTARLYRPQPRGPATSRVAVLEWLPTKREACSRRIR